MTFNIIKNLHIFYILLVFLFVLLFLASCSSDKTEKSTASTVHNSQNQFDFAKVLSGAYTTSSGSSPEYYARIENYDVVLGADEIINVPGIPGELRVWIGNQHYEPNFPDQMIQDKDSIPALGGWATVQPFAPAFKIDPIETHCIKIHPSGSEVRFKLIPTKQGSFEVGANINLFDSPDCSGAPIPKTASTLKVLVKVNPKEIFIEKMNELWNVLWEKFVEFWAALVAIFFGVILFLFKGKLKKWFGYEND